MPRPVAIPAPRTPSYEETGWPLVARAQAGDRDALAQLYTRHAPHVLAYVTKRLTPFGRACDAEDIASDVWVRALRHLPALRWQGVSVLAWLYTVARNLIHDYGQSAAVRRCAPVRDFYDYDQAMPPVAAAEDVVTVAEMARVVRDAVAELPETQRVVIEMRFLRGLSVRETADALGLDPPAVKSRQYRACQRLAQLAELAALK